MLFVGKELEKGRRRGLILSTQISWVALGREGSAGRSTPVSQGLARWRRRRRMRAPCTPLDMPDRRGLEQRHARGGKRARRAPRVTTLPDLALTVPGSAAHEHGGGRDIELTQRRVGG